MVPFRAYAIYDIGIYHITVFYHSLCDDSLLSKVTDYVKTLPIGRKIKFDSIAEFDDHKNPGKYVYVAKIMIMNEDNTDVDHQLMERIKKFSNEYSFRSNIVEQYDFNMHITLGSVDIIGDYSAAIAIAQSIIDKLTTESVRVISS